MVSFYCANKIRKKPKITELLSYTAKEEIHIFLKSLVELMSFFDRLLYPASYFVPEHTGKLC